MVVGTEKNSAAEEAGLKSGDIITEIDHKEIATGSDISRNLQECDGDRDAGPLTAGARVWSSL
jgi:S1-C subfamily serine protease